MNYISFLFLSLLCYGKSKKQLYDDKKSERIKYVSMQDMAKAFMKAQYNPDDHIFKVRNVKMKYDSEPKKEIINGKNYTIINNDKIDHLNKEEEGKKRYVAFMDKFKKENEILLKKEEENNSESHKEQEKMENLESLVKTKLEHLKKDIKTQMNSFKEPIIKENNKEENEQSLKKVISLDQPIISYTSSNLSSENTPKNQKITKEKENCNETKPELNELYYKVMRKSFEIGPKTPPKNYTFNESLYTKHELKAIKSKSFDSIDILDAKQGKYISNTTEFLKNAKILESKTDFEDDDYIYSTLEVAIPVEEEEEIDENVIQHKKSEREVWQIASKPGNKFRNHHKLVNGSTLEAWGFRDPIYIKTFDRHFSGKDADPIYATAEVISLILNLGQTSQLSNVL